MMFREVWSQFSCFLAAIAWLSLPSSSGAAEPAVKHPNFLLNQQDIDAIKAKVKKHEWAAKLFERVKALADTQGHTGRNPREAAIVYALTGEARYAKSVRESLLGTCRNLLPKYETLDLKKNPDFGAWGSLTTWCYAYDLTYDTFSDEERQLVEKLLRTAARTIVEGLKIRSTDPDMVFGKHFEVGLVGFCLGDKELIEWGLNDPGVHGPVFGGFYQVMDNNIHDKLFWSEAPRYALARSLQGMLSLAEAALHYDGTDLYHYTSKKTGASIKGLIDGYLRLAYPLEKTGIGLGSLRMASYGDASTSFTPSGQIVDTFLINPVQGGQKLPVTLNGELELAWKRYKDPGYAWLLSLNLERDAYVDNGFSVFPGKVWGYIGLTHGEPLPEKLEPPPAPSGVYPGQGIAVLRSDESGRYWTSGASAAVLRLGSAVGHGHKDYYHLMLHGKGRLLYPDIELITYEPTWLNWTHEGIAHNTLLVDGQSPRPSPITTRQDLGPEAKFFAVSGSAFEHVEQTRALLMTPEYLVDVFRAADTRGRPRTFDWVMHGMGRLYPGNPAAYKPTNQLLPSYWWIENERGRKTDDAWQADWIQQSGGIQRGLQPFGKEWFDQTVGVRLTMLGAKGTEVYTGDGPITDGPPHALLNGNPEGSVPLVAARRKASAVTFTAVHEPFDTKPSIRAVDIFQQTADGIGLSVLTEEYIDDVLVAFTPDKELTFGSVGYSFTFRGQAFARAKGDQLTIRGQVSAFRMNAGKLTKVTLNGKPLPIERDGRWLVHGKPVAPVIETAFGPNPAEHRATVHPLFDPNEVHLRAGGERQIDLRLRCVGRGEANGKLRLSAPKGISVEPATIDLAVMKEGDEKSAKLLVKAEADMPTSLDAIRLEPIGDTPAAIAELPVTVGVVMTEDRRIPLNSQWVVRAPGYTMKVDHQSGVACYLLDPDGHRRHGMVNNSSHGYLGIGAVEKDGMWPIRFRTPCRFVSEGKDRLIVVNGSGTEQVRLRYVFHEDHVVLSLVPPTDPTQDHSLWFGDFDALGPLKHNGGEPPKNNKNAAVTADWFFWPHPVHRHGMLLVPSSKSALRPGGTSAAMQIRAGQEVSLQFVTEEELPNVLKQKGLPPAK